MIHASPAASQGACSRTTFDHHCPLARTVRRRAAVSTGNRLLRSARQQATASDSFAVTTRYCRLILDQDRALPQTLAQEREVTSLGSVPLIVISATAPEDETRRVWTKINGELAALSINGVHRVVQGATHQSLVWKSADAKMTTDSIRQVLDAARTGQPLVTR
jgi:hypothetical protein